MKANFGFLRRLFWNYIFAFLLIFSIYSIPFIFLAILGCLYLFQTCHWFIFSLSVFSSFLFVFFLLLLFRFFRLPRYCSNEQIIEARSQADDFINSFPYKILEFNDPKFTFSVILVLNRRIARACGVRSAHPELDVPVGYFLRSLYSISTDLEQYCKQTLRIGPFEPLYYVKLNHILWFVPKSSQPSPDKLKSNHNLSSYIPSFLYEIFRKKVFRFIFERVAHYSIELYSGKVLSQRRFFSFRNFSSFREFFRSRLLLWPIVLGIFGLVFFCCLVVAGLFYSTDSVWELIQIYRNARANGFPSFSTLPWDQIFFRVFPGLLALIFSCVFYFLPFFFRFRLSPFNVQPIQEWPEHEKASFKKTKEFISRIDDVSRFCTFSSLLEVVQELLSSTDNCYRKPQGPAFSLSLLEVLKGQQILISHLQTKFDEEFPFMNYLNIRDFLFVNRLYSFYLKFFLAFRTFNFCVNPMSGSVAEARIHVNRTLLQSLLEEFLITGNIFLLNLIGFHLIEVYSGHLHFPENGLPLVIYLAGGTDEERQAACSALLNISNLKLDVQMETKQGGTGFTWFPSRGQTDWQLKKLEEQMDRCDLILFLSSEKLTPEKSERFQKALEHCKSYCALAERPPLVVLTAPASQTPLPCSANFYAIPWNSDDESVLQDSLKSLIEQNQQKILSRQTFRFIKEYRKEHGRYYID